MATPVEAHFKPDRGLYWEQFWLEKTRPILSGDSVVVDVGANIGNHTVFWSRIPTVREVHAFEPFQPVYARLLASLEQFPGTADVRTYDIALGNGEQLEYTRSGHFKLVENGVPTKRLDEFEFPTVTLLKIDTEGAEMRILEGAVNLLRKFHPFLWVEYHPSRGVERTDVWEFLKPFGYTLDVDCWLQHNLRSGRVPKHLRGK